jgi:hypothetical protein
MSPELLELLGTPRDRLGCNLTGGGGVVAEDVHHADGNRVFAARF